MIIRTILAIALLALSNMSTSAQQAAEVMGYQIVSLYCSDCHAIGKAGESTFAPAPRFRDLHKRYDVELLSEALVEGIVTAHPEMPEFEFDPIQAEAIVQYLKSLEPSAKDNQ